MIRPVHETVCAAGRCLLAGTAVAIAVAAVAVYLGPARLAAFALIAGAGLILLAKSLKRQHQRGVWRKP